MDNKLLKPSLLVFAGPNGSGKSTIKCVFVLTADPELNVYRVATRVSKGGHDVPTDKIIDRYSKSLANIKEFSVKI